MARGLHFIVLCLASGLWISAIGECADQDYDCGEPCPPGWVLFDTRCFLFQPSKKAWADAEHHCTSLGGNLASIQTRGEYTFIRDMIRKTTKSHKETWVGGTDASKEGRWLWSDGSRFVFSGWARGEPNNLWGEDCMEINFKGRDYVNDADCRLRKCFVCAKDP